MLSPRNQPVNISNTPTRSPRHLAADLDDDIDSIPTPSSKWNGRPGKRSPVPREGKYVRKGKARVKGESVEGECHLLGLPDDVLTLLLSRIPPRSLVALASTCQDLRKLLEDESIWRASYINRFFWDGAAQITATKGEVKVLVQGCKGESMGWRKEALAREAMLDRWISSKATPMTHTPPVGLIHTLSLSYPAFTPAPAPKLVVGKNHPTSEVPESPSPSPKPTPKMTHRQKYEALLAATTRPAPYVLCAGLGVGGVVRSDPLSGKVSKGFWGPGRDGALCLIELTAANFHLRPHLDNLAAPSAVSLPLRDQSHVLWGLLNGNVVHTTILTKQHSTHGGRAASVNVASDPSDGHEGVINEIFTSDGGETFVTAGEDGRVKLWRLHPGQNLTKSGKKSPGPGVESVPARVECVWSSGVVHSSLERSEIVKLRQAQAPDPITLVRRRDDVICCVTEDGDLRIWTDVTSEPKETRIDVGSAEAEGPVKRMKLDVDGEVSVLIHHRNAPTFTRYHLTSSTPFETLDHQPLSCLRAFLEPTPPISAGGDTVAPAFGRFVVGGDQAGGVHIWSWNSGLPIRSWSAMTTKITALDYSCGILAVGSCDGWIKIYDPLPNPPALLRSFHANHLSPADTRIAMSEEFDAMWFNVNQITLENDLIVAAIGRKVFAWRAGSAKGRQSGKKDVRKTSGSGPSRGNPKGLGKSPLVVAYADMKAINRDAADDHLEIQSHNESTRTPSRREAIELAAMENLGLDDGDEALQYAIMMSMEGDDSMRSLDDEEDGSGDEAVRAVEEYTRSEERQILEALRRIDRAEQQSR